VTLDTFEICIFNLQATATSATKGKDGYHPLRFSVWFKILYSVGLIPRLIQHCLLSKMVYLNVKYGIATRNYEFFIYTQNLIGNITLSIVIIPVAALY